MNLKQSFRLALKSMAGSKLRSFLTMLGVIIGISAVIILVSIVQGFSDDMVSAFESIGANTINVTLSGRAGNLKIDANDMLEFADDNRDLISAVSPIVTAMGGTVKYGSENITSSIYGVNEDYKKIKDYTMGDGRFITYVDTVRRNPVCIIGTYIANELFGISSPINKTLKINGMAFTIVGVLEESGDSTETSADNIIIMPYSVAVRFARNASISSYALLASDTDTIPQTKAALQKYLYSVFKDADLYSVSSLTELVDQIDDLTNKLAAVLAGIAAISLLVGGIGIMNIMLVSVMERTREIGIRKAIGGKRRDILSQFVIEATMTSALGGVVGIILGAAVTLVLAKLLNITGTVSVGAVLLSFSVSVLIGVLFGYFPAAKAAKLNPIDALRYD